MSKSVSQTIREDMNATIREKRDSNATIREGQSAPGTGAVGVGGSFRDYRIIRQLPSTSTEADIFVIEKDGVEYILKHYRYGIEPKSDILQSIKAISEAHPQNFIRVYEADFDKGSNRWFEIQEYAKAGTLQAVLDDRSKLTAAQQSTLFNDVARQVGESLNFLHQNNLLHLDIKPSNILLRSLNPLDMVLIDFGIATSLASDMSKKFTQTRGTPMYQSPESYTGGMGRASDWWGLGMILLEIAAGAHPFKGLSANVIAYSVATEPVNIPGNLDEGQRDLFHGLLTRNPEKRWNWEQVSRWLKGERGIPQYFEETAADEVSTKTPFVFMGQKYQSLAEIAAAFAKDEESWDKGKEFLMRGYVRQWLEGNQEFDATLELDNFLGSVQDSDEKMFRFIQKYGQNIPFIFCGKAITLQNLLLFTGKAAKREVLTLEESKIVNMIENGGLLACMRSCQMPGKDSNVLRMALEALKGKSVSDAASFLNFYMNPKNYYCPFVKDDSSPEKVISASMGLKQPPRTITDWWDNLNGKYILPKELVDNLSNVNSYHATFSQLEAMAANGLQLIPRESSTGAEKAEKEALASASQRDYTTGVYKWVLGYDDASIKALESSLEKFKKQAAYASGFEKAQLDLWLAYLEFLEKRTTPLTDDDKKLLQNVRLKDADMVCSRLQVLVSNVSSNANENSLTFVAQTITDQESQSQQFLQNSNTQLSEANKETKSEAKKQQLMGNNKKGKRKKVLILFTNSKDDVRCVKAINDATSALTDGLKSAGIDTTNKYAYKKISVKYNTGGGGQTYDALKVSPKDTTQYSAIVVIAKEGYWGIIKGVREILPLISNKKVAILVMRQDLHESRSVPAEVEAELTEDGKLMVNLVIRTLVVDYNDTNSNQLCRNWGIKLAIRLLRG